MNTGNRLKDDRDSGVSIIEQGVAHFVEQVKTYGTGGYRTVFSYLYGSSGLGKTQLAFALKRGVLYIPLGE
jgi:DNA replication protein DnaC